MPSGLETEWVYSTAPGSTQGYRMKDVIELLEFFVSAWDEHDQRVIDTAVKAVANLSSCIACIKAKSSDLEHSLS